MAKPSDDETQPFRTNVYGPQLINDWKKHEISPLMAKNKISLTTSMVKQCYTPCITREYG
jgi:hypothetical protein